MLGPIIVADFERTDSHWLHWSQDVRSANEHRGQSRGFEAAHDSVVGCRTFRCQGSAGRERRETRMAPRMGWNLLPEDREDLAPEWVASVRGEPEESFGGWVVRWL